MDEPNRDQIPEDRITVMVAAELFAQLSEAEQDALIARIESLLFER